jgi:SAM-dependent methyltransferase
MKAEHRAANRANWDERAVIHARTSFYDVDGFVATPSRIWLHPGAPEELGDVHGKRLVHLQCHLGVETLSWGRLGARRVVGVDFSQPAILSARATAARLGLSEDRARFVVSDVHDAAAALADEPAFDVVFVSVGAICWLPSIARWADVATSLLAPGGVLYMREVHPMLATVLEREGHLVIEAPYFESAEPRRYDDASTYADPEARLSSATSYEWCHGLGETVQALLDRGLVLEVLREHRDAEWQALPSMTRGQDGLFRLPVGWQERLPLTFSVRARRPG